MRLTSPKTIYLDYAASTPIDSEILKAMKFVETEFANPSAIHTDGIKVRKVIDDARQKIAKLLYAHSDEIVFTGSGTESDALALIGVVRASKKENFIPHIITTTIEHPAILENCKLLEKNKEAEVTYVDVDESGIVNPKDIRDALKDNTVLVSCMYANNEIGTIQPIMDIAKVIRHHRKTKETHYPYFHTDACQAMNYLPTENIEKLGVDLMTFNSSKIYGPKGIGILYIKRGTKISPLYMGGGQEFNLRPGTENISAIVGIAKAFEKTVELKGKESNRLSEIRNYGIEKLLSLSEKSGYEIVLNGDREDRLPNNINISISGISSELLVIELDAKGIEVSAKSACKSEEPDESYVIAALHKAQEKENNSTDGSLRITLGRQTKKSDIDTLIKALQTIVEKYRKWK